MNHSAETTRLSDQLIVERFPFPIAYLFANRVVAERDNERRVKGIIHTFENSLRYLAMLVLGEYRFFPDADQRFNELLRKLVRPTVGDLNGFVRMGVKRLNERGHEWFIPELPMYVKRIQGARGMATSRGPQNLIDSLLSLRNRLAHHEYEPDWALLANNYHPILIDFLTHLQFLIGYPLCRFVGAADHDSWTVVELVGIRQPFPEKVGAASRLAKEAANIFLSSEHTADILPLSPFVIMRNCESCVQQQTQSPVLTDEVFLLNGTDGDETTHIGVRHAMLLTDSGFAQFRERKRISLPMLAAKEVRGETVYERALRLTNPLLEAQQRHETYVAEAYVSRDVIEEELRRFLLGDCCAFLILGESGIGKSCLLCHWTSALVDRSIPVIFLPGADLNLSSLEELILANLGLTGTLDDLLTSLEVEPAPLVLIIDGLNEHPRVSQAVRLLNDFIHQYAGRNLRVVFSLRTSHFRQILEGLVDTRLDPEGSSFFSPEVYHESIVASFGGTRKTYQQVLARLGPDSPQLEQMYEGYRRLESEGSTKPLRLNALTPFSELSKQVRDLISNPWYLRLVLKTYHGREIPSRIFSTDIVREYCEHGIFYREDTAELASRLVDLMCQNSVTSLTKSQLALEPDVKVLMIDNAYEPSPYSRLVEDGVIVEFPELTTDGLFVATRNRVQFAFDSVMEFLIASRVLSWSEPTPELIQQLLTGSISYLPLAGAVRVIWSIYAQRDEGELILQCIERCDGAILAPLVPTLRQLEAHDLDSYERILKSITEDNQAKSGLILLMLGEGMALENGIEAQNRVFEKLYRWKGQEAQPFRFFAGKYLMFGYLMEHREDLAVAVYNDLQELYAAVIHASASLVRLEGNLTSAQRERIYEFAWVAEQCGRSLLEKALGVSTDIDSMLSRLKLDWLPNHLKFDVASIVELVARVEAMTGSESARNALEGLAEGEKTGRFEIGLRAIDNSGLNIASLTQEQMPKAIDEVELEIGFLHNAYQVAFPLSDDSHKIIENLIRVYLADKRDFDPYLGGKLTESGILISNSVIIAEGYKQEDIPEKRIEYLMRAEAYASALETSELRLEVYNLLMKSAKELGANDSFSDYADRYLECDAYVSMSEETKSIFFKDDPFELFIKSWNLKPDEAERMRVSLLERWGDSLVDRCGPWLSDEEKASVLSVREAATPAEDWESYLRERVYNYDKLRTEQKILEINKLLLALTRDDAAESQNDGFSISDLLGGRLLLLSMRSDFYTPSGSEPLISSAQPNQADPTEYNAVLEQLKRNWLVTSTEERITGAAAAAVFPSFVPLIRLEQDEEFCAAIGKEARTDAAVSWIHSLIRCWCADVIKGRRGSAAIQEYLKTMPNLKLGLNETPQLVMSMVALHQFWFRTKALLDNRSIDKLTELSASADNLGAMIEELRSKIPATSVSASGIVMEIKEELRKQHEVLLTDFDS